MEERLSAAGGDIAAEVRAGVATVTLDRPAVLNALSFAMLKALGEWLERWRRDDRVRVILFRGAGGKAFCAGGDVREIHASFISGGAIHHEFFAFEYALDYRIHAYPKPIVSLLDGIVMGGGMGISQGTALRIVGDRTRMAMPETAIGLFPDVGGSYFLSRVPGKVGLYLALLGATIGALDAIDCGLADAYFDPDSLARLDAMLVDAAASPDPHAAVRRLAPAHESGMLPKGQLESKRRAIDRHFAQPSVRAILASLEGEASGPHAAWARECVGAFRKRSPTMLEVTFEQIRRGAAMALADCFRMELGLVTACFEQGDFAEGIRAVLVDKDNAPRWNPPTLEQVARESVERFFAPRWSAADHPLASLGQDQEKT